MIFIKFVASDLNRLGILQMFTLLTIQVLLFIKCMLWTWLKIPLRIWHRGVHSNNTKLISVHLEMCTSNSLTEKTSSSFVKYMQDKCTGILLQQHYSNFFSAFMDTWSHWRVKPPQANSVSLSLKCHWETEINGEAFSVLTWCSPVRLHPSQQTAEKQLQKKTSVPRFG